MKSRLLWKLLAINGMVIALVILIVWLTINYLAADYFVKLGRKYDIAPIALHQMFLDSAHRSLLWSGVIALGAAGALSVVLTRRTLRPLFQMAVISHEYAAGNYDPRVVESTNDEVGQLARAFNAMADGLRRTEELRKNLVSDLAHELRSPLTNIRGSLEALSDGVIAPEPAVFTSLHDETMRLTHLVESLLRLSHADAARTTLQVVPTDIDELAGQVIDLFRPRAKTDGLSLETDFNVARSIHCDSEKVAQILINLVENACRYTPQGGHIRCVTERLTNAVRITVTNSGDGIATADLPRIFERFFRGEKSRSRAFGGAGIGLAIVHELVLAHGGHVEAASIPGETRIGFILPD